MLILCFMSGYNFAESLDSCIAVLFTASYYGS